MHSLVTIKTMDKGNAAAVSKIFGQFDESVSPSIEGLRRRQLFRYYDLLVHIQDFAGEESSGAAPAAAERAESLRLAEELEPYVSAHAPGPGDENAVAGADRFYEWDGPHPLADGRGLFSTVIVNWIEPEAVPEVARLFGGLDETDFPEQMGTRRRQLFVHNRVYLHVQDFQQEDGLELIDQAWKEADPRFVRICADLDPLVKKYDPEGWRSASDQVATRFYRWVAA